MTLIVYADFTAPASYLASRRVDALIAAGVAVDWRAVEQHPRIPATGRPLRPDDQAEIERQMASLTGLLLPGEELPWTPPRLVPKTEAAISGYAEAYEAGVGDDVRRLLYTAYWRNGANIGSPEVLRRLLTGPILRGRSTSEPLRQSGYAVAVSGGPITTAAWRRIWAWREEWTRLGTSALPALVEDGGQPVTGEEVLRRLEKEILRHEAALDPDLPDPGRYPAMLRPDKAWVSQVGGRWAHTWMPTP